MSGTTITEGIAKAVLAQERHPLRFEAFCNDIVGAVEGGIVVLATSRSWDLGRDGRARTRTDAIFTCSSLTDEVDQKSQDDLKRLAENCPKVDRVYFCSSQPLSERECSAAEGLCLRLLPEGASVIVLGATQLAEYAVRYEEALRKHYRSEIEESLALLSVGRDSEQGEDVALRLSLTVSGCSETAEVRDHLYRSALREVFADGQPRTVAECARDLSACFHLGKNVPDDTIRMYLQFLAEAGELVPSNSRYQITALGIERYEEDKQGAIDSYLGGREQIRASLERSVGAKLSDDSYARVWGVIQEKMTHFFFTRGQELLRAVSSLLNPEDQPVITEGVSPLFFVQDLAEAVAATASHSDRREELRLAVSDIFEERSGPAFDWLTELCAGFVALCSLGLEESSGKAIARVLSRTTLVFDTDVALSLLSPGEPDHEGALAIQRRWKALGGRLLVAEPVLRELAHHAWIAQFDFAQVRGWLPGSREERLRLIENAYVRGFAELLAGRRARLRQWSSYMGQYRGRDERDTQSVATVLRQEFSFELLAPRSAEEADLEKRVSQYLVRKAEQKAQRGRLRESRDKARRDASLYSAMVREVRACREREAGASCFLVSSARRLADAEAKFSESGEPQFVISIPMAVYLLSLTPNVSLGLGALRSFLFEGRVSAYTSDVERTLLRVLKESGEYDIPWAKRGLLIREVREKILRDAHRSGYRLRSKAEKEATVRRAFTKRRARHTAEIIREALDEVAVDSHLQRENVALKQRITRLEEELVKTRARR